MSYTPKRMSCGFLFSNFNHFSLNLYAFHPLTSQFGVPVVFMLRSKDKEKIAPSCGREREPEGEKKALAPLFMFLSLGLSYVNWAGQDCFLFYLRFSLRSLDLPLFYFRGLSLPGLLATAILDSFSLF